MSDVYILGNDGIGGLLQTVQAAHFVKANGDNPIILCPSRDEVFKPFDFLVSDSFKCLQVPEGQVELLIKYGKKTFGVKESDEIYLVYPDGIFRNPYSFDFQKYKTTPAALNELRTLTHKYNPKKRHIYINMATSTEGYLYQNIPELVRTIANTLPDYEIHCSVITKWANKNINMGDFYQMPKNVLIYQNDDIINQINIMSQCEYGIFTDNGFSHISYHLGQNRLLIDPRYGYGPTSLIWRIRWRETDKDSLGFNSFPDDIANVVKINLEIPQTTLLPKYLVLMNQGIDWSKQLLFAY